jgi:hypothetical protein
MATTKKPVKTAKAPEVKLKIKAKGSPAAVKNAIKSIVK